MLDLISRIKEQEWSQRFDPDTLNRFGQILRKKLFIPQHSRLFFYSHVKVKVIVNPSILEDYVQRSDSCLFREKGQEQTDAFSRFLQDPGALYFSIESKDHSGYVRFYAAQEVNGNQILFEDALCTKPDELEKRREIFQPDFKSVSLRILWELDAIGKGYLFGRDTYFEQGEDVSFQTNPLRIQKLGSNFFKKKRVPCFYEDEYELNQSIWPNYTRSDHLLNTF